MKVGNNARNIRFGLFQADLETAELWKAGAKLALQVQPFQVLAFFLQHPGELVTREQLRSHIWPNDTFVDFDHALNTSIAKIRLALGDDAEHPTFIETLPRRGYRFIVPIQKPAIDEPPANAADPTPRKRTLLRVAAVLATMIVLSAIVLWQTSRKRSQPALPSIEAVPLVALQRSQASPAFSPDGNQVAFGGYEGEDGAIYTALIGGDKPLRLTVESGVCCPTWSPDGRQIAFFRFLKEKMIINVISALGGAERTLYAGTDGFRGMCGTMDWSPNGKWLAFGESNDKGFHSRIALLSLDDLTVKELTSPVAQEYDCEPAFSPDGSSVTFERGSLGGFGKDLFVIPVASGKLRRLTFDNAWGGTPAWTQDGTEILFSSNRGGLLSLWRVSATGGSAKMIPKITTSCW